jgi:hypothetical protein
MGQKDNSVKNLYCIINVPPNFKECVLQI